jgi:hypothetical protein
MAVLNQISDARVSREFSLTRDDGSIQQVQLLEYASVDDLMVQATRAIIAEKAAGIPYESVMDRTATTTLIQVRVPVVRR